MTCRLTRTRRLQHVLQLTVLGGIHCTRCITHRITWITVLGIYIDMHPLPAFWMGTPYCVSFIFYCENRSITMYSLVGRWTNPFEKWVKLDHFPKDRGENNTYLNLSSFRFDLFTCYSINPSWLRKNTIPRCFLDSGRQSFGPSKGNSTNPKTQPVMQYPNDGSMGFGKFTHMNGWLIVN